MINGHWVNATRHQYGEKVRQPHFVESKGVVLCDRRISNPTKPLNTQGVPKGACRVCAEVFRQHTTTPKESNVASNTEITDAGKVGQLMWKEAQRRQPTWTVDELLLHPTTALDVCKAVRSTSGRKLRDDELLRCLLNARKRGLLN